MEIVWSVVRIFLWYVFVSTEYKRKKYLVSPYHLSQSVIAGVLGGVLHFSDLTMISEYTWCFQGMFCFVQFCFHDGICLASYLVGYITGDLVILVCVFPGRGGTV